MNPIFHGSVLKAEAMEMCDSDAKRCYICLSEFGKETVAALDSCQHVFCLQCIQQWSEKANTCPVDRISFSFILPEGDAAKKIYVEKPVKDDDADMIDSSSEDDEDDEEVNCEECGRSDARSRLLVCMSCDSGFHVGCAKPPSAWDADGDWSCAECALCDQSSGEMEDKMSDGEPNLETEACEDPSSSSRCRPCTLTWSSGSEPAQERVAASAASLTDSSGRKGSRLD
ncbi:PHD and RING finger domain-containing protein 1-like [Synchiropus splendidus]|uniref:PHD and RING finger domain-containing protein 1-like n=1 Tax=Synchiropus splendidus TaxID=270530 RepID=UPI00237D8BA4|nr:PHD and RING finger domain-containing protein 1-like [Synchiropus splendidus]